MPEEPQILSAFLSKVELSSTVASLVYEKFGFNENLVIAELNNLLDKLCNDLYFYVEYPYVDKFYRNSYYNYFSTKHKKYPRTCIRISVFNSEIKQNDFRTKNRVESIKKSFKGFIIIRPTLPRIIGRTILSPSIFKFRNFGSSLVSINCSVNGVKLSVKGFPYSSQDGESITCAETSLWVIMEYFGNKYAEYTPVLPSTIISILSKYSCERQLPSHGLDINQLSFALKEFNFGVRIYHKDNFPEFKGIFFDYIESGIPFIATLQNSKIGHAITVIGQENISNAEIDLLLQTIPDNVLLIDSSIFERRFLCMDDNLTPYTLAHFDNPAINYTDQDFIDLEITSIIVPLYQKIYKEAFEAKNMFLYICNLILNDYIKEKTIIRHYLASSRSFKNYIALNDKLDLMFKDEIINKPMPKFVWVAELSTINLFKKKEVFGMMLLDATEANEYSIENSILFIAIDNKIITLRGNSIYYKEVKLNIFDSFSNLAGEENE